MVDVSMNFGAVRALENANFTVDRGEIVGLVGDNGAGKSTLIKILSGVNKPSSGEIYFDGRKVTIHSPEDARKLGIETIYQDLAICEELSVWRNVFLSREIKGSVWLNKEKMKTETTEALKTLEIKVPSLEQKMKFLSGGQRQTVALARSLYFNAKVLLMDEPTAALGVAESNALLQMMLELKKRDRAIVFITHNLRHIFSVVDRLTVLYKGRTVADVPKENTTIEEIEALIVTGNSSLNVPKTVLEASDGTDKKHF
jgi:simple sugar transport system ATP-binding protein